MPGAKELNSSVMTLDLDRRWWRSSFLINPRWLARTCKSPQKQTTSKYWRRVNGGSFEQCKLFHFPFHPWTNLRRISSKDIWEESWMQIARPSSRKVFYYDSLQTPRRPLSAKICRDSQKARWVKFGRSNSVLSSLNSTAFGRQLKLSLLSKSLILF